MEYSISEGPDGISIDASSGMISWKPSDDQTGKIKVRVSVFDGYDSESVTFYIDVTEAKSGGLSMIVIVAAIVALLLIIIVVLLVLVLRKKKDEDDEDEDNFDEESRKIQEDMEHHQKELEWEQSLYSDHNGDSNIITNQVTLSTEENPK
jgi:flagellar biosynthesis/type III secretory pathway M-ring protein FliF/YscJ